MKKSLVQLALADLFLHGGITSQTQNPGFGYLIHHYYVPIIVGISIAVALDVKMQLNLAQTFLQSCVKNAKAQCYMIDL